MTIKPLTLALLCVMLTLPFVTFVPPSAVAENQSPAFQVKDAATAIQIAKVAFASEFGRTKLKKMKYFEASLNGDHWMVTGYIHKRMAIPPHGGAFDFVISVNGGCVMKIIAEM